MSHRIGKPGRLEDDVINTSYVKPVIIHYLRDFGRKQTLILHSYKFHFIHSLEETEESGIFFENLKNN
jgi:hypothetical protein